MVDHFGTEHVDRLHGCLCFETGAGILTERFCMYLYIVKTLLDLFFI